MTNHLAGGKVNISLLQEHLRKELLQLIDKCDGPKITKIDLRVLYVAALYYKSCNSDNAVVWDEALAGPIGIIAKYGLLKDHNVQKMFPLKSGKLPPTNVKNIIFISRPHLHLMDLIAENIHGEERSGIRKECHLFFVPRRSQPCETRLQAKGVFGNFNFIEDLPCDIFPFDSDLLSMEVDLTFKDFYLEKDPTSLYQAAQAIMLIQTLYGKIPRVSGKGETAAHVWSLMGRLSHEDSCVAKVVLRKTTKKKLKQCSVFKGSGQIDLKEEYNFSSLLLKNLVSSFISFPGESLSKGVRELQRRR
uniref:Uncharacterized protein n=1 Tax=Rhodnius prolixus TaxID=13249 RepID=T1I6S3_RHOPR